MTTRAIESVAAPNPHCRIGKIKPRGNVVLLHPEVQEPQAEINREIVDILTELLDDALEGRIETLVAFGRRPGKAGWFNRQSATLDFPDAIGQLEILQQSWIAAVNNERE